MLCNESNIKPILFAASKFSSFLPTFHSIDSFRISTISFEVSYNWILPSWRGWSRWSCFRRPSGGCERMIHSLRSRPGRNHEIYKEYRDCWARLWLILVLLSIFFWTNVVLLHLSQLFTIINSGKLWSLIERGDWTVEYQDIMGWSYHSCSAILLKGLGSGFPPKKSITLLIS